MIAGWGLHPPESAAFARRTPIAETGGCSTIARCARWPRIPNRSLLQTCLRIRGAQFRAVKGRLLADPHSRPPLGCLPHGLPAVVSGLVEIAKTRYQQWAVILGRAKRHRISQWRALPPCGRAREGVAATAALVATPPSPTPPPQGGESRKSGARHRIQISNSHFTSNPLRE